VRFLALLLSLWFASSAAAGDVYTLRVSRYGRTFTAVLEKVDSVTYHRGAGRYSAKELWVGNTLIYHRDDPSQVYKRKVTDRPGPWLATAHYPFIRWGINAYGRPIMIGMDPPYCADRDMGSLTAQQLRECSPNPENLRGWNFRKDVYARAELRRQALAKQVLQIVGEELLKLRRQEVAGTLPPRDYTHMQSYYGPHCGRSACCSR
jgi:hypothetical protein